MADLAASDAYTCAGADSHGCAISFTRTSANPDPASGGATGWFVHA